MLKTNSLSLTLFFYITYQVQANGEDIENKNQWTRFIFREEVAIPLLFILVILSGMLSGLTLGLLGLDLFELKRIASGAKPNATPDDVKNAQKIIPIRQHGNWLLCTLLVGNVAVNAAVSILLADYTSGLEGFILSTVIIVIFGEILPQATCARYPLVIGAKTTWFTNSLMIILSPVAYPISCGLDIILPPESMEIAPVTHSYSYGSFFRARSIEGCQMERTASIWFIHDSFTMAIPRAQRRRNDLHAKNVTKRGNVAVGKAAEHNTEESRISKPLIAFFLFVVVGSSLVQVFNLFGKAKASFDEK